MVKPTGGFNFIEATIKDVHKGIETGQLTARNLVENYIKRIEAYDKSGPSLNSVITINPKALETADLLDKKFKESGFTGPLHGIPVLVKDNINTKDLETTAGSQSLKGFIPKEDAFIIKKIKEAGGIILAKVNLHEFAVWGETVSSILGQTLNPYDLTRTPGGSSGGTGASVAANFGMLGLGTDTINSVRSPASACSLVGFRPTVGLISRGGIVPYSLTQDTAGPITRTVEDAVKLLDIVSGYDPLDPATAWSVKNLKDKYIKYLNQDGLKGKRIGVLKSFFGKEEIHREVNDTIYKRLDDIKSNGAILIDINEDLNADVLVQEISVHLHELKRDLNKFLEGLGELSQFNSLAAIIKSGKYHKGIEMNIKTAQKLKTDTLEYYKRLSKRGKLRTQVVEIMAKYSIDALVYPHQKRPVVKIGETQVDRNGVLGSVTGFPCCVLPAGFTKQTETAPIGIPIGIEFLAREWDETTLIEIAYGFEQITRCRKPPTFVPSLV